MDLHDVKEHMINCFIISISDTRTIETDKSWLLIKQLLQKSGHHCVHHVVVRDEQKEIAREIDYGLNHEEAEAILMTGGTGIAMRDVTIEVVEKKLEKELPGFGELFRMLSYTEDIGSAAMMSRAIAGVSNRKVLFAMPGSSGAVKLAMEKLILPELSHILHELHKD